MAVVLAVVILEEHLALELQAAVVLSLALAAALALKPRKPLDGLTLVA
jgi:hypothetical protein